MELLITLMLAPCVAALAMLLVRNEKARDVLGIAFALVIACLSIAACVVFFGQETVYLMLPESWSFVLTWVNFALDITVGIFVLCYAAKYRRWWPLTLAVCMLAMAIWYDFFSPNTEAFIGQFRVDALSLIMILIIGIIGSGICVYALGYMKDFQAHHPEQKDRRPWFFALMFAFLSAMFNIVVSDNLVWIYTAWEITTLCSFLLIGFTKTDEAINNAFRQIWMNMLGGIAFQVAIIYTTLKGMPLIFSDFILNGTYGSPLFALPVALLAFAGLTKAAQMPFHTWLLGAMVAPTPTSALLHSSTMVKAGVFLLVRLSPLFMVFPASSIMVVAVGGFTFMMASFLAISQSNAKRVLAYSTIANLGLIAACAGVGTPEAVWAAIFLIIFHAVAKSLLFLCVGTAEHHIGSRNIEDMDELFERMPRLARFMMLGAMGMFIAPFGMLISKWATLVSFANTGQVLLLVLLAFGSAATFMFWAKWLGKLAGIASHQENVELSVHKSEWAALLLMACLFVCCCVAMPFLSMYAVEPYIGQVYNPLLSYNVNFVGWNGLSMDNMAIMSIIVAFVVIVMFGTLGKAQKKIVPIYLAGFTAQTGQRIFKGSLGDTKEATLRNWYMDSIFGEKRLDRPATVISTVIIAVALWASAVFPQAVSGFMSLSMYMNGAILNEGWLASLIGILAFLVCGPVLGCLLAGIDRKLSARMQGRVGPPLLQPYYDVRKLIAKDDVSVNTVEGTYITCALVFTIVAGGTFFAGGNFLMCVFLVTLSALFFVMAAYSARSPFAQVGADRECLQIMSYEPMLLFCAVCMYLTLGTFDVAGTFYYDVPMIATTVPIFAGLLFVLTIKLRKSPFDLSYSHHAHQELVKGVTTEMSGKTLAKVEIMHWCETVLFLGWVGMFFITSNPASIAVAVAVALLVYLLEIWIDNNFARVKWQACLKWAWAIALVAGLVNVGGLVLYLAI